MAATRELIRTGIGRLHVVAVPATGLQGDVTATTVSGRQRMEYFAQALKKLPVNVPVNTVLVPMEGDPMAASAFWQLAQLTRGSFLSPTEDWP